MLSLAWDLQRLLARNRFFAHDCEMKIIRASFLSILIVLTLACVASSNPAYVLCVLIEELKYNGYTANPDPGEGILSGIWLDTIVKCLGA